ncbi:hypothetical protein D3Z36_16815 [Lachnospiraceae bacterium]|nr:hypothetical protein [Lachnospiraceae bacterium]
MRKSFSHKQIKTAGENLCRFSISGSNLLNGLKSLDIGYVISCYKLGKFIFISLYSSDKRSIM